MKKLYPLCFAALAASGAFAQKNLSLVHSKGVNVAGFQVTNGYQGTLKTVTGGLTCSTQYIPGTTMNLTFSLLQTNTDGEYIDSLSITFPSGFTINSSSANPAFPTVDSTGGLENLNGVSGQTISWGSNVGNTDNYGGIDASPAQTFTINVTSGSISGNKTITYFAKGDEYPGTGSGTNGDMSGTVTLMQASAVDIQALGAMIPTGCSLGNEQVQFAFKNNGMSAASNFPVKYIVNGGTAVTETYTSTVNPGDTVYYTFTTLLNMSAVGTYNLAAFAKITADGNVNNDSSYYQGATIAPVTAPYSTSFEPTPASDLDGWVSVDVDNSGFSWAVNTGLPHSGTQSLRAYENANPGASDDWLISSCTDLTSGTTYRLTYWKRLTASYKGSLGISIGNAQSVVGMTTTLVPLTALPSDGNWNKDSVDFTVPSTGTYYIGFEAVNTDVDSTIAIRLDDINLIVSPMSTGVKEMEKGNVSIYPSPSNGVFNVTTTAANSQMEVFNVIGKNVYSKQLINGTNTFDLSNMAEGTYFVRIISADKVSEQKIIITK